MMRTATLLRAVISLLLMSLAGNSVASNPELQLQGYIALCYHDIRPDVDGRLDHDPMAVHSIHLARHFAWLQANHYQPVSLRHIEAARRGESALPDKAVLLTFDDGFVSFYNEIFPLLQRFNYPAVFALVTSWQEYPAGSMLPYENALRPRDDFLSSQQIREIQASGLVEFASHSHAGHTGVQANPQGNNQAFLVTRRYDPDLERYESESEYRQRIHADLSTSHRILTELTGVAPSALVWPYGEYSDTAWEIAQTIGFTHSLVLDDGRANTVDTLHIRRHLIQDNPNVSEFAAHFRERDWKTPKRVIHVDLDYVFDPDPAQQTRNLDALIQRISDFRVNTVYLQAYADPEGDGHAAALYFPNRHLPVRADLFSHVAWQLRTRAGVNVYAWMPVSAFVLPTPNPDWMVWKHVGARPQVSTTHYQRLSIFHPDAETWIDEIYQDLGRHAYIDGVLFHDDGLLTDFEDANPHALLFYQQHGLERLDLGTVRQQPAVLREWTDIKTQALTDFTLRRAATLRRERPRLKTARNLFAQPVLNPTSEHWFNQSLDNFIQHYDHTAIMAMPWMEGAGNPDRWMKKLIKAIDQRGISRDALVIELQSRDWNNQRAIDSRILRRHMNKLARSGLIHYGYYPDDFLIDQPQLDIIRPALSLDDYPWSRR
jgi:poly-beta-1,6-N-acetyl-D-glucosamine N-deacetylase